MNLNRKPSYQPWNEEEFQADVFVRGMTHVQRWMYRTLLQASFFHTTRPYLPVDDKMLWILAGCENRQQWEENKAEVLERFTPVEIEGVSLLENKRVTSDWDKLKVYRGEQSEKGRNRAAVSERLPSGQFKTGKPGFINASQQPATAGDRLGISQPESSQPPAEVETEREVQEEVRKGIGNTTGVGVGDHESTNQNLGSEWKTIAVQHKRLFGGKKASSHFKVKYAAACKQYGEALVLVCFSDWATSAQEWVKRESVDQPLHAFFKKLPEMVADEKEVAEAEQELVAQETEQLKTETIKLTKENEIIEANVALQKQADFERMNNSGQPQNEPDIFAYLAEMDYSPEEIEKEKAKVQRGQ